LTLWNTCIQDCDLSWYYLSYMRYKKVGDKDMIYVYNEPLIPKGSTQYKNYTNLYNLSWDISSFDSDITRAFYIWKFKNSGTNSSYQKFIKSIK
jgi:hypothetical protein